MMKNIEFRLLRSKSKIKFIQLFEIQVFQVISISTDIFTGY